MYWLALSLRFIGSITAYEAAAEIFEKEGYKKESVGLWNYIGDYYRKSEKWEKSRLNYQKALSVAVELKDNSLIKTINKAIADLYSSEGQDYFENGNYEKAQESYKKAIEVSKDNGNLKENLTEDPHGENVQKFKDYNQ